MNRPLTKWDARYRTAGRIYDGALDDIRVEQRILDDVVKIVDRAIDTDGDPSIEDYDRSTGNSLCPYRTPAW